MRNTGPDVATREVVINRALMTCEKCSAAVSQWSSQLHHRQPRGAGGCRDPEVNSPANLLLLCRSCHAWIESNRTTSYEQGWLVRRGHDPAKSPVWLAGRGFVFLDQHGDVEEAPDVE